MGNYPLHNASGARTGAADLPQAAFPERRCLQFQGAWDKYVLHLLPIRHPSCDIVLGSGIVPAEPLDYGAIQRKSFFVQYLPFGALVRPPSRFGRSTEAWFTASRN